MPSSSYMYAIAALREVLAADGEWVEESPQRLRGAGSLDVILENTHGGETHVDVGLRLNRDDADTPILWDCMAVASQAPEARALMAARLWKATTFAAARELMHQSGEFADHYAADDPEGMAGWHVIHSPVPGWGTSAAEPIQQWPVEHPLLPALSPTCLPQLDPTRLNTLKVFLGGGTSSEIVEVRINGSQNEAAAAALRVLDWPRIDTTWVRAYILAIHPVEAT